HDPALLAKPTLVAFNKLDQPAAVEAWPAFRHARAAAGQPAVAIAAAGGEGIRGLRAALVELLPSPEELAAEPEPSGVVVHRIEPAAAFVVSRDVDGAWRVSGARIERLAAQTDFGIEESAERFQRTLARLGIDAELRRAG